MLPSLKEARLDLNNIRQELEAMRRIHADAIWLSTREDVDGEWYKQIAFKVSNAIHRGSLVESKILSLYPELL